MKYRYKLTILLVVVSLVPMTVLALYSHSRMSSLVRKNEMEDMYSIPVSYTHLRAHET